MPAHDRVPKDADRCKFEHRGGTGRCKFRAINKGYCSRHEGIVGVQYDRVNFLDIRGRGNDTLAKLIPSDRMAFYAKHVGPKLKALLQEADEVYKGKEHDITEEVQMTRAVGIRAVTYFSGIMELTPGQVPPDRQQQLLAESGSMVIAAMDQSSKLVERAAKIYNLTAEKISPTAIDSIVQQICRMIYTVFEAPINSGKGYEEFDDAVNAIMKARITALDNMLSEELELPSIAEIPSIANRKRVSDQIFAMEATVPRFVEDDEADTDEG